MLWYQLIKKSIEMDFEKHRLEKEKTEKICLSVINKAEGSNLSGAEQPEK